MRKHSSLLLWVTAAAAAALVVRAIAVQRRGDAPAPLGDNAALQRLGRDMARARALSDLVRQRSADEELRAAAERWHVALAEGGEWSAFLPSRFTPAPHVEPEASRLAGHDFDVGAAREMRQWLDAVWRDCERLLGSASPELRERVAEAMTQVEASACDLDLYLQGEPARADARAQATA